MDAHYFTSMKLGRAGLAPLTTLREAGSLSKIAQPFSPHCSETIGGAASVEVVLLLHPRRKRDRSARADQTSSRSPGRRTVGRRAR
jgi:hypothetical protein